MAQSNWRRMLLGGALAAPAFFSCHGAAAQSAGPAQVETLIVTAAKRAENVQDVPMSITAVSGDTIERRTINSMQELATLTPSLQIFDTNTARSTTIMVRGVGTFGSNSGLEPSVGLFLDGVYMPASGAVNGNLLDIATVEVLRGPQGTLYGRNTPVGAININTREPTHAPEAMVNLQVGNYGVRRASGYVGGGLGENLAGRLSAWVSTANGFEKNLFNNSDIHGRDQYGVRGRLKWTPTDTVTANAIAYYTHIKAECCVGEQLNPTGVGGIATPGFLAASAAIGRPFLNFVTGDHRVASIRTPLDVTDVAGASVKTDWELGGLGVLTSITAYNYFRDNLKEAAATMTTIDAATSAQDVRFGIASEELRLASPDDQRLSYIAGVYLFRQDLKFHNPLVILGEANRAFAPSGQRLRAGDTQVLDFKQRSDGFALFGQAKLSVTDQLRLIAGGRFSSDRKDASLIVNNLPGASALFPTVFPSSSFPDLRRKDEKFTWLLEAEFKPSEEVMLYALASTGFKDGGFSGRTVPTGLSVDFRPETSKTYEVGLKSQLLDRRLVLNVDAYQMRLNNFQDAIKPPSGIGTIVSNAGNRRVRGVELDFSARPVEQLSLSGGVAYTDATFTSYPSGVCATFPGTPINGAAPGSCNYQGRTPYHNPKWQWNASAEWTQPVTSGLEAFAAVDLSYVSSNFLDAALDPRSFQPSYTLVNARLGIGPQDRNWRVAVWGKNLTNEVYYSFTSGQPVAALLSAGGTTAAQGFIGFYAPPRTYGVDLTYRF